MIVAFPSATPGFLSSSIEAAPNKKKKRMFCPAAAYKSYIRYVRIFSRNAA